MVKEFNLIFFFFFNKQTLDIEDQIQMVNWIWDFFFLVKTVKTQRALGSKAQRNLLVKDSYTYLYKGNP